MGIMIENDEIISMLTRLAEREGVTKAEILRRALSNLSEELDPGYPAGRLFPRDRISHVTYKLR